MNQDDSDLQQLMARALDGDRESYARFLERIAKMVRSYLMSTSDRRQMSADQVEDLVQDVLISIHEKKHTYQRDLPVLPWVFAIARYRFIDAVRAGRRQPLTSAWSDEIDETTASGVNADETAHRLDAASLLDQLPPKQREVLLLAKVEQLSMQQISERLKMSVANVKVTIHRAMAKLAKQANAGAQDEEE